MDHLTEQDAGLLEQAASMLEEHAEEQRTRGNCSTAEGAACSAHAIRRLAPALLRAGRGGLAQIEEPAQTVADVREAFARRYNSDPADPACAADLAIYTAGWQDARSGEGARIVLDDNWKARMLDGRAPERDEMGLGDHPELPWLDEGMKPRGFFAALGLELTHTMAEDQLDGDALEAMSEAVNWTDWAPTPPQGHGWKLVAIFDTEEGPAAWWLRELAEAEDGTTTIRNLQAEVEKLKARAARAEAAHVAKPVDTVRSFRDYLSVHEVSGRMNGRAMDDMALDLARIALDFKHLVNAQAEPGAPAAPVDDLAALVKQLVQALRKAAPNHVLPAKALDYLRRQDLLGSPLRASAAAGPLPSTQET